MTRVEDEAFSASGLTAIELPKSVTVFQNSVFLGCSALKTVTMRNVLTELPKETFKDCKALTELVWPEGLKIIRASAFENCASLKEIDFPETMQTIESKSFYNCDALERVIMNEGLKNLSGSQIFYDCDVLDTIELPNSVISIGSRMFAYCDKLSDVKLGTGITVIPEQCFFECQSLQGIDLPYRVATIQSKAFANCTKMTQITILRNATNLSANAFSYPDKLTIYGVAGTYAETYAGEIGATFAPINVPATNVALNETSIRLARNATAQLIPSITPANFTDATAWKTSDANVATVTDDGLVKAVGIGEATISFVVGNLKATSKVTVVQPVTSVSLNKTSLSMNAGDTFQLTATASPNNAENKEIKWSTSDESIASVDENGLVTALKKGTATITATAQDGGGASRSCTVTVLNNLIPVSSAEELQSAHPYDVNANDIWQYSRSGAESLSVTFSEETSVEEGSDYIIIFSGDGKQIGKYTGEQLAGKTVNVPGDVVKIQLTSDDTYCEYGFAVTNITPVGSGHVHSYTSKITPPNCVDQGYTTHTCACGDSYVDSYVPALGHNWDSGKVTLEPTETASGIKTFTCIRCGESRTEVIPATSHVHNYDALIIAPTCTDQGYTLYTCSGCGDSYKDSYTTPLEHNYVDGVCTRCGAKDPNATPIGPSPSFTDVKADAYYANPVAWAVEKKITNGTSSTTFSPDATCTRGQVVTFLWRASGSPEPTRTDNPFTDVKPDAYYYKAVLWAVEKGITSGTSKTTFSPDSGCTRGQVVTFQWRANGQPEPKAGTNPFTDVKSDAYYYKAVLWAVENGITNGTSPDKFSPDKTCTRGQIVTFLYRDMK